MDINLVNNILLAIAIILAIASFILAFIIIPRQKK